MTFIQIIEIALVILAVAVALTAVVRVSLRTYFEEKRSHLKRLLNLEKHQHESQQEEKE